MNAFNHYIFALWLSLIFFKDHFPLTTLLIAVFVFSVGIDVDQIVNLMRAKRRKEGALRSWLQEPLGFFFVFVPLATFMSYVNPYYFPLILLIVASHIFLDYLTHHHVRPLAPLRSHKKIIGIVKPFPEKKWRRTWVPERRGISELYILAANMVLLSIILV